MKKCRGFTIVEMVLVIAIMGILLTLAFVSLSETRSKSRDYQRQANVESFSSVLENLYSNGYPNSVDKHYYPGTSEISSSEFQEYLHEYLDDSTLVAPESPSGTTSSIVLATNANQSASSVTPAPSTLTYIYQPIDKDGLLCSDNTVSRCVKYNLYYKLEDISDDCTDQICTLESKHS